MIAINAERLWSTLNEMARIGATPAGGVTRLTLSDEDRQARDLLRQWAQEAGFPCAVDSMGNMFIRRAGKNPQLAPVLTGSHVDSQPLGGRYDGIYGVLAGLEALRTLNERGIETERDIVLVNWTNEEGARFAPAMLASGVWAGQFSEAFALARKDRDGISVGAALEAIGYRGERPTAAFPVHACYEVHIEQGPILEEEDVDIGLVHAAMGQRWFNVTLEGFSAHAGTTPMGSRRDALTAFAELALAVEQIGIAHNPDGRATIGMAQVIPGSRNVVPGRVECSVEFRHPQSSALEAMEQALRHAADTLARRGVQAQIERIFDYAPIAFNAQCLARSEQAVQMLGYSARRMVSGAGHDTCYISKVAPASMIFIPCEKGISHNEAENILPTWAEKGANVLLHSVLLAAREK
ncbi:Zn-dependent hydrolase [Raoultella ornithinolytica]|uniref:Zn-dependent hydrolase n=2 Tax=Raoultella ornithinolytica TaxID=54291 RepID=A0A4P1AZE4_RAOOR|nr:Zn-dependent hydrolase [Raoultella ornithinolytica]HDX8329133.1 Zn-dependent hydrolase [Raoultella ornithinolytica CD1_MRS_4]ANZ04864.1 allantoate amidohydrolase [Raoultella ornithinolytica]EKV0505596.1 Zn-dependent hydrolase [Raoultella ornithinolytica]EKV6726834.1 Zn-dependent hydrolase [Raoultella ornithinolytica]EKW1874307.1 Zn-dependent hydrolase [Raoultella ornithinolytica]